MTCAENILKNIHIGHFRSYWLFLGKCSDRLNIAQPFCSRFAVALGKTRLDSFL